MISPNTEKKTILTKATMTRRASRTDYILSLKYVGIMLKVITEKTKNEFKICFVVNIPKFHVVITL